ncbi:MAG: cation transporter (plasmid) [Candidatus Manganitrophus sp.]|nr:cation transporter [Candidatus Manganitrophus sp.]
MLFLPASVTYVSIEKLIRRKAPEQNLFRIVIALLSVVIMPTLFYLKYQTGQRMKSRSVAADSKQTLACVFLSVELFIGLGVNYLYGLWWGGPVAGLIIVFFSAKEGYDALKEEKVVVTDL